MQKRAFSEFNVAFWDDEKIHRLATSASITVVTVKLRSVTERRNPFKTKLVFVRHGHCVDDDNGRARWTHFHIDELPSAWTTNHAVTSPSTDGQYNITHAEQRGVWTTEEHDKFLVGLKAFPEGPWKAIADHVGTRSARQVQTHAQKYYEKVARRVRGLRKDRKKVVRSEHRLDEDMIELCKDMEGDAETKELVEVERTQRGLSAIAMRRRSASPNAVDSLSASPDEVKVEEDELCLKGVDSSLACPDQECLDYLVSVLEAHESSVEVETFV
ncbi:Myb-like dna-binding protein, partial [Globisporangium splendens]